ncbi:MAG TPA: PIN domain-containing protein [Thermoanaerobaculia bacterium]|nr:PIN domain-containing protein [Thermoanaerobaculia bacterium]
MAERFLLDTSAVFSLTDREPGFEQVRSLLHDESAETLVCSLSLMEIYYIALQEQGEDAASSLVASVKVWPVRWVWPTERDLLLAGRFKAFHRLSFADAAIAAAAANRGATLVHKDPEFEALGDELGLLALPYK